MPKNLVCLRGRYALYNHSEVFRTSISMRHYGAPSCKPTCLWSNSWHVEKLNLGPLQPEQRATAESLATSYVDRRGVKRCVGKKKYSSNLSPSVLIYTSNVFCMFCFCKKSKIEGSILYMCVEKKKGPTRKHLATKWRAFIQICMKESGGFVLPRTIYLSF